MELLLWRRDGVLGGLGHAELHHGLRLDLDGFTGLGIAAHARLALGLDEASDAGDYEYAVLLGLFNSGLSQKIKESGRLFVGQFELLGHMPGKSSLGHSSCHVMFSFASCCLVSRRS